MNEEGLERRLTAIRALDVVARIEQSLGKPVVTAKQALFWQSLRAAGYRDPIAGHGAFLELPSNVAPAAGEAATGR